MQAFNKMNTVLKYHIFLLMLKKSRFFHVKHCENIVIQSKRPSPNAPDQCYTARVCVAQPPLPRPALHCYTVSPSPISLHCSSAFVYNSWLMERFQRRLERLRQHHNKCASRYEQTFLRQETMGERSTQLDAISEEQEDSDSSESELSSCAGLDPDYKPGQSSSSSDLSPDKGSSWKNPMMSSEILECSDTNSSDGAIKKTENTRTYGKKHHKLHKIKKTDTSKLNVTLKICTRREDKKRAWDKRHYCLYCGKSQLKISRHLERKHMDVKDVAYAFSFSLGSKQRKSLLEQLRNKGDFKHNSKVLEKGRGQIVTWKQPSDKASVKDYLPCPYCFGMFKRKDLWRHQSSCRTRKSCVTDEKTKNRRSRIQSRAASLLPIAASSDGCQSIINQMRQDDVSFHIRSDSLICNYGESLYAKHGRVKSRHQYIAQRMRELGRFMLVAKDMDKTVNYLEDLCVPSKYQLVVSVAKCLTQFSPGKNEFGKPSTAVKIGFCLKGAVEVLIGQTLMNEDDLAEKKAKKFLELLEKNWRNSVSVTAHQTIQEKRWNKDDDIPLTKNVIALRDHLRMVEDEARNELTEQMDLHAYKTLNESVLAQVIIFNKRREGEASRLTLDVYMKASTSAINEDIYKTLSPLEKQLSKLLTRIEIRGKRGKKVPVFLTKRMKASIDLLVQKRVEAGVPAENPYLFARPGVMTNIRGCDCLRKYAKKSKAENPELLRSTKLRKQVATLCQLLDLSEQELEQVARFMGHDIRVHRDFYRQTDKTFQIAKISKLLFAMEQGTQTLRGKNLNTLAPACGEGPTLNSVGVSPRTKRKRVKLAEDGGSDLSSPEKTRQSCREADGSDVDDDCSGANLKKKPTPNKKRRRQTKSEETKDGGFDFSSPEKRLKSCREADGSDVDDDCSGANLKKKPTPNKNRRRQTKSEETKDGGFDLSSPEKTRQSCREADGSDVDDDCSGANLKKKPTPNKNRRRQTKSEETKDGGFDLSSTEKTRQSCREADGSDVDDDCSGANLKKKPTPNKNRRRQTTSGETKYGGSDLSSPKKRLKSCHEADGSDVDDDCSGANLKKKPTPNKNRRRQTKSVETKYGGFDLSSPEKRLKSCHEADDSDVDDDCSGANLKKKPTPNKNRRRQTKSGEAKDGGADLSFLEKRLNSCREDGSSESDVDDECSGANLLKKPTTNKKIGRQTKSAKVSAKVNVKRPWSEAERSAVHKHLAKFIAERRVPGKLPCMKCIEEEEALNERSWKDVKNFVYNTIVTLNRRSASRKLKF
ncbi:uncharacterized protein [Paramisgurnus dabryanus]|uniref:uncharacterized protein isoform X1 n=2 Tax=Paramisgurnus dabryanus TaxID=90735 RepID=UPI0031F3CEA1